MSEVMQANTEAPRWPGGGHRTLAEAIAVAIDWAMNLPAGAFITTVGFGGGPVEKQANGFGAIYSQGREVGPSYWWSGGAEMRIDGGLNRAAAAWREDRGEQKQANVRRVVETAVAFSRDEERRRGTKDER